MNIQPRISIVLPTYNVEPYIDRCIQSLLNQTENKFEIVFVDDCGNDNSISIVRSYAENDARIRVVSCPENLGTFKARRIGVEAATGDYILFLDPDDELENNTVETLHNYLNTSPDLIFYGSRRVPAPKFWQLETKVPEFDSNNNKEKILKDIFQCKELSYGTEGKLIKREILQNTYKKIESIELLNKRLTYGEDKLLFPFILIELRTVFSCHCKLYIYHKNTSSITNVKNKGDIVENMSQLDLIINVFNEYIAPINENKIIKDKVVEDLLIDYLRLQIKITENRRDRVILAYRVFNIARTFRNTMKIVTSYLWP